MLEPAAQRIGSSTSGRAATSRGDAVDLVGLALALMDARSVENVLATSLAVLGRTVDGARWADERAAARAEYEANLEIEASVGSIDMAHVIAVLRERLPKDTIIANDAGNSAGWAHRYLPFSCYPSQLGPTSGAMGYCLPAAIAAARVFPERVTIGFAGDGAFMMSAAEIATAVQYGLKPIILLVNNGSYGTIRMHQEREYPDRVISTELANPDFKAFVASFGAHAESVGHNEEFAPALERSLAAGRCAVIEIRQDVDAITTRTTLNAIREAALKRQAN